MTPTILIGDVREQLAELPAGHFHTCVTSPPYWGLRDYGTASWEGGDAGCDHKKPDRQGSTGERASRTTGHDDLYREECPCGARRVDAQIGLEPTPEAFVSGIVEVFRAVRRVLRDDGTCWVNLGDSYNGQGARSPNIQPNGDMSYRAGGRSINVSGLKPKDLIGIPWRVALALQADGWYLRSDIIWAKPNPMPESCTDRPTKSHEHVFLLTKKPRYYYDAEAIKEGSVYPEGRDNHSTARPNPASDLGAGDTRHAFGHISTGTRNARDVWTIPTQAYSAAHFATFPEELPARCIKAGTSERGCCPECGAGWVRVVERTKRYRDRPNELTKRTGEDGTGNFCPNTVDGVDVRTTGWVAGCQCRTLPTLPCRVLDPFLGSGTTLAVAAKLGRTGTGIELNPEYAKLAEQRIGRAVKGQAYRDEDHVNDATLFAGGAA